MKFNIKKKCPKCKHSTHFDFTICPHCGKKVRNIRGKKLVFSHHNC